MFMTAKHRLPELRTVTGDPMTIYGIKYIDYEITPNYSMIIKYFVCDVQLPIVSVSGMNYAGYSPVMGEKPYILHNRQYVGKLLKRKGLYFIQPTSRRKYDQNQRLPQGQKLSLIHI